MTITAFDRSRGQFQLFPEAMLAGSFSRLPAARVRHPEARYHAAKGGSAGPGHDSSRAAPTEGSGGLTSGAPQRAIIAVGCAGLAHLATRLRRPMYLLTSCDPDQVWNVAEMLRDLAYGACNEAGNHFEPGWDNWFPSKLAHPATFSGCALVQRETHSLRVSLPAGMTCASFDAAFSQLMWSHAVDRWSQTSQGVNSCERAGLEPGVLRRRAGRADRAGLTHLPVRELVPFRASEAHDVQWLELMVQAVLSGKSGQ